MLLMSCGSTHGVGMAFSMPNVAVASSFVGFSRSGRNVRYMSSCCSIVVLTFVG